MGLLLGPKRQGGDKKDAEGQGQGGRCRVAAEIRVCTVCHGASRSCPKPFPRIRIGLAGSPGAGPNPSDGGGRKYRLVCRGRARPYLVPKRGCRQGFRSS
jgi:hypothetical protein